MNFLQHISLENFLVSAAVIPRFLSLISTFFFSLAATITVNIAAARNVTHLLMVTNCSLHTVTHCLNIALAPATAIATGLKI